MDCRDTAKFRDIMAGHRESARRANFWLIDLPPIGCLAGKEKRFDEFAFATKREPGKPPGPLAFWHLGLSIEPAGQQNDLFSRNMTLTYPYHQMSQQRFGQTCDAGF